MTYRLVGRASGTHECLETRQKEGGRQKSRRGGAVGCQQGPRGRRCGSRFLKDTGASHIQLWAGKPILPIPALRSVSGCVLTVSRSAVLVTATKPQWRTRLCETVGTPFLWKAELKGERKCLRATYFLYLQIMFYYLEEAMNHKKMRFSPFSPLKSQYEFNKNKITF